MVENNIMINNTFHPHVWFRNSNDIFRHNIVLSAYQPIDVKVWGKEIDYNIFPDLISLKAAQDRGTDKNSVHGQLLFVDPDKGDFRVREGSVAFSVGFRNFAMDSFGVVSPRLKALAKKVTIPSIHSSNQLGSDENIDFMGAKVKNLTTLGERSATGMGDTHGVLVLEVPVKSAAFKFLQANDVILSFNSKKIRTVSDLFQAQKTTTGTNTEVVVFRNQNALKIQVGLVKEK